MLKKKLGISSLLYFAPFAALAQEQDAGSILAKIGEILNTIIPLIIGLAFLYFLCKADHLKETLYLFLP